MRIKTFFISIGITGLIIASLLTYYILLLSQGSEKLKNIEHYGHIMVEKAHILRQSLDDLSRFSRSYVVAADKDYKDSYLKTLDIRNGKAQIPKGYSKIYWDLFEPIRTKSPPKEEKSSIDKEIQELVYTPYELEQLKEAKESSDDLVNLETEAFYAMEGLFKDKNANFTIKGEKDQALAIKLLHSKEYNKAKEKVVLTIDKFLFSREERIHRSIDDVNHEINLLFQSIFILLLVGLSTFFAAFFMIRDKVLTPIEQLTKIIIAYKQGDKNINMCFHYDDEVGLMTEQFFSMKKKIEEDYEEIKKISLTDPLTNINNRRSFFDIAEQLLKLYHRNKEPFSVMLLDIDYFKKVNDVYGHILGDEILKHTVSHIKKEIRESDVFARYGGEEFIILLINTDAHEAADIAEKVRSSIENNPYVDEQNTIPITISIGLSQFNDDESIQELIERSDSALYKAKERGRNRVVVQ